MNNIFRCCLSRIKTSNQYGEAKQIWRSHSKRNKLAQSWHRRAKEGRMEPTLYKSVSQMHIEKSQSSFQWPSCSVIVTPHLKKRFDTTFMRFHSCHRWEMAVSNCVPNRHCCAARIAKRVTRPSYNGERVMKLYGPQSLAGLRPCSARNFEDWYGFLLKRIPLNWGSLTGTKYYSPEGREPDLPNCAHSLDRDWIEANCFGGLLHREEKVTSKESMKGRPCHLCLVLQCLSWQSCTN